MHLRSVILLLAGIGATAPAVRAQAYALVAAGSSFGPYHARAGTPLSNYVPVTQSRAAFSPSLGAGYRFSDRFGLELAWDGDGRYAYDGWWRGAVVPYVQSQTMAVTERLSDVALRVPIGLRLGDRLTLEVTPGAERQFIRGTYSEIVVIGPQIQGGPYTSVNTRHENAARWAGELGARVRLSLPHGFSTLLGYRTAGSPDGRLSVVSLGLSAAW